MNNGIETKVIEFNDHRSVDNLKKIVTEVIKTGENEKKRLEKIQRNFIDSVVITENGKQRVITIYNDPKTGQYFISENGEVIHAGNTRALCSERAYRAGMFDEGTYIKFAKGDREHGRYIQRRAIRARLAKK